LAHDVVGDRSGDPVCNVELREFSSKVDLLRGEWQNLAARHIQTLVEIGVATLIVSLKIP